MEDKKIYDEITKNLNNLVNNLELNPKFKDAQLMCDISKYLTNEYINRSKILYYRVNCKYPIVDIYITTMYNHNDLKININRFDRISKLIKLKEIENATI